MKLRNTLARKWNKRGSVLVLSLIFASIIGMGLASLLTFQGQYHKMNVRNLERTRALNIAESGIQLVMHELLKDVADRWGSGWTISGDTYAYTDSGGILYSVEVTGLT